MNKISKFTIRSEGDSLENIVSLKNFITEIVNSDIFLIYSEKFSKIFELPKNVIDMKLQQLIYNKFNFESKIPQFEIGNKFFNNIKYLFLFFIYIILNKALLFFKNNKTNVKIILDNVEGKYVIKKFAKILSKFETSLILTRNKFFYKPNDKDKSISLNTHFINFSKDVLKNKNLSIFKIAIELFFLSQRKNINFIFLFFQVFYSYYRYSNIFKKYKSNYLIHDRIYHTCPIRNFLFKIHGGKKIFCSQSHLVEGAISMFSDLDVLLTLGNETDSTKKIKILGGNVQSSIPCGSLRMESEFVNENLIEKLQPIDILIIGLNHNIWKYTSKITQQIYYEQISWLKKISLKYPNLNIIYKHHPNFKKDKLEEKILSDTNIKVIIKSEKNLNSYHYLMKSKVSLSFGSTMILEGLGLGKKCFFLDPDLQNNTFFGNLSYLDPFRIKSLKDLEEVVVKNLILKENDMKFKTDKFCLPYKSVSKKTCEYIFSNNLN